MKLIIQQYLAALNERDELDAILPDLLSQMGLNVYSTPGRGTRQDGVDVGAVGKIGNDEEDKVYLFSIKAGDLTRNDWDGDALQSLRPSLNEIIDSYIPNRLPPEHQDKEIVICLCFGGVIKEQVRPSVKGYIDKNSTESISFQEWNGDKLADVIQSCFLREELLPANARSYLRKSLALLDEPDASYRHFSTLVQSFIKIEISNEKKASTVLRQLCICLWIHFSWAREDGNIESSYRSSELALLYAWEITKSYAGKTTKVAKAIHATFHSIASLYHMINFYFLDEKVIPLVKQRHALSVAIRANCDLDINIRIFDVLGRMAIGGIWIYSLIHKIPEEEQERRNELLEEFYKYSDSIKHLVVNNPSLKLPIRDEQAIDISLAVLLLLSEGESNDFITDWLSEILNRAKFTIKTAGTYPCILQSYGELLDHPIQSEEYFKESTSGSLLYPMLALCADILNNSKLYKQVQQIKTEHLSHCNFQLWFPDKESENHLYMNSDGHGAALSEIDVVQDIELFGNQVFGECDNSDAFKELSAAQYGYWPLILVACRHYRLPVPVHLFRELKQQKASPESSEELLES